MNMVTVRLHPVFPTALVRWIFVAALVALPAVKAEAEQIIGQISSVDQRPEAIEIDGELWSLSPRLEIRTEAGDAIRPKVDIRSLRRGQVVLFDEEDGLITSLTVLPDAMEVPR